MCQPVMGHPVMAQLVMGQVFRIGDGSLAVVAVRLEGPRLTPWGSDLPSLRR
jgi:hypothetical protein